MDKLRPPVLAGYDLAIEKAKHLHTQRTGKPHGAVAWLAGKIGVTRQTIDNWSERAGFPEEYVSKVAKLLDMPPEVIRPETVIAELPKTVWEAIAKITPRFLIDQAIVYTTKRRRHGKT
jgi:hypothetical protein